MNRKRNIKISKSATYGPLATTREWIHCLLSVKHAETTWLRIEPEKERRAFRFLERFIFLVFGMVIATTFFAIRQQMFFHDMTIYKYNDVTIYSKPN